MKTINTVIVLGASGTIGSLVGGLLAQNNIKVFFLSRSKEGAIRGLKKAIKQARSDIIQKNVICGDYDSSLQQACGEADWILECVTEDSGVKNQIFEEVDAFRRPGTIVSSVTSSLPLVELAEGRSSNFRENFLSTHFYNPPGKMLACELAGTNETCPEIVSFMHEFLKNKLNRVVIPVRNSVGFAGNRIAFLLFNKITALAQEFGVEVTDYLIGPYTGRIMAPLATIDLVGLDIHQAIIHNLQDHIKDTMLDHLEMPEYIKKMIARGCLGNKTPKMGGFYKKQESSILYWDPNKCEYIKAIHPHYLFAEDAKQCIHLGRYREAFDALKNDSCKEADIVLDILCTYICYSYYLVGEVTDERCGVHGIDQVMAYGFNWAGPSLLVQMLGGKEEVMNLLEQKGMFVPDFLKNSLNPSEYIFNSGKYFIAL